MSTANLRTKILDFRGLDSSRILSLRGGISRPIGNFRESLSQAIFVLVGVILVGRLGVIRGSMTKGPRKDQGETRLNAVSLRLQGPKTDSRVRPLPEDARLKAPSSHHFISSADRATSRQTPHAPPDDDNMTVKHNMQTNSISYNQAMKFQSDYT